MKVLWFEITIPKYYKCDKAPVNGWQDSLQEIVMKHREIDLTIAFEGQNGMKEKEINGVKYVPLIPKLNYIEKKILKYYDRWTVANKLTPLAVEAIERIKPDIIHVFGTEWSFGQVAKFTRIPVVIHMQGCIAPYLNAEFPPLYSLYDRIVNAGLNFKKQYYIWRDSHYNKTWKNLERSNFESVKFYMGRTRWDKNLCHLFHQGCKYYYCSEALRPEFYTCNEVWRPFSNNKLQLITVGCTNYWKGMDTVLRTAKILKNKGVDFEWKVIGYMPQMFKSEIEHKEKENFSDNNINLLGFVNAKDLIGLLLSSHIYIHTAYIDKSPNAICEAQYLGMPIIATYVGGIPSLIKNDEEGLLIPANAPYTLASEIIMLGNDHEKQIRYSHNTKAKARIRHNPDNIYNDLINCYKSICFNKNE